MVFFNYALRKLNAKIVYYGPGLCGKTTNLAWIHDHFEGGERGKMISLATEGDRTIFFDLLPLEIGSIRGMDVTLQLYTVPGQVHYNSTRQLVLRGADGVVFVADSQRAMQSSNIESFRNLQENLLLQGISLEGFPLALQFNKRDLKDVRPVEEIDSDLNIFRVPIFEAVATEGVGVQETLEGIVKLVMRSLRERYEGAAAEARSPGAADPAATMRAPLGSTPRTPAVAPTPAPAPKPSPARSPGPAPTTSPAAVGPPTPLPPRTVPTPPPPVTPPAVPIPTPAAAPPRQAIAPPKSTGRQPAAPIPGPSRADDFVFPEEEGARTRDFSKTVIPAPSPRPPVRGFEDEVSTAVYDVRDDIQRGSDDFSGVGMDGDVFASPDQPSFVDEVTKAGVEDVMGEPPAAAHTPAPETAPPPVQETSPPKPAASTPFDEPAAYEEPEIEVFEEPGIEAFEEPTIEFMTDDSGGDAPPPTVDLPPADRYVDRIVAPSPFAPRGEPTADEDRVALAELTEDIVVDESSDDAIEVPLDNGFEEPEPTPVTVEEPFGVDDGDPFADRDPETELELEPEPEPELEPASEPQPELSRRRNPNRSWSQRQNSNRSWSQRQNPNRSWSRSGDPNPNPNRSRSWVLPLLQQPSKLPYRATSRYVPRTTNCTCDFRAPVPSSKAARCASWISRCRCPVPGSAIAGSPCSCV